MVLVVCLLGKFCRLKRTPDKMSQRICWLDGDSWKLVPSDLWAFLRNAVTRLSVLTRQTGVLYCFVCQPRSDVVWDFWHCISLVHLVKNEMHIVTVYFISFVPGKLLFCHKSCWQTPRNEKTSYHCIRVISNNAVLCAILPECTIKFEQWVAKDRFAYRNISLKRQPMWSSNFSQTTIL